MPQSERCAALPWASKSMVVRRIGTGEARRRHVHPHRNGQAHGCCPAGLGGLAKSCAGSTITLAAPVSPNSFPGTGSPHKGSRRLKLISDALRRTGTATTPTRRRDMLVTQRRRIIPRPRLHRHHHGLVIHRDKGLDAVHSLQRWFIEDEVLPHALGLVARAAQRQRRQPRQLR